MTDEQTTDDRQQMTDEQTTDDRRTDEQTNRRTDNRQRTLIIISGPGFTGLNERI